MGDTKELSRPAPRTEYVKWRCVENGLNKRDVPESPTPFRFYEIMDPVPCNRVIRYKPYEMKTIEAETRKKMIADKLNKQEALLKIVCQFLVHWYRAYARRTFRKIKTFQIFYFSKLI